MADTRPCRDCGTLVVRTGARGYVPLRCPPCAAERQALVNRVGARLRKREARRPELGDEDWTPQPWVHPIRARVLPQRTNTDHKRSA